VKGKTGIKITKKQWSPSRNRDLKMNRSKASRWHNRGQTDITHETQLTLERIYKEAGCFVHRLPTFYTLRLFDMGTDGFEFMMQFRSCVEE
jgi:hypothetical protein